MYNMKELEARKFIQYLKDYVQETYGEELSIDGLREMIMDELNNRVNEDLSKRISALPLESLEKISDELQDQATIKKNKKPKNESFH